MWKTAALIILALTVSGCATPVYVFPELDIPDAPLLPTVAVYEFEPTRDDTGSVTHYTITQDVYRRLAIRETLRKGYINELRAVLDAHNAKVRELDR